MSTYERGVRGMQYDWEVARMSARGKLDKALQDAREVLNWSVDDEQEHINILHNHLSTLIECIEEVCGRD